MSKLGKTFTYGQIILFIVVTCAAAASGFLLHRYLKTENTATIDSNNSVIGTKAFEFEIKDIDGIKRNITDWKNKTVLLNFWATWCPPCLREIPDFIELQKKYIDRDFQIVGIALDDIDDVKRYKDEVGINYPILVTELDAMELTRLYGNQIGALPYSVFIDMNGEITHTITGELDIDRAEKILRSLNISP